MGVLRGFALVIISVILFLSFLATGIFATLNYSLTYENVQPRIYTIADEIVTEQIGSMEILNQLTPYLKTYCINKTEIVQSFQGYTFVFPCDVITQGQSAIINHTVNYLVSDFYYKEYNCTFIKCFEQSDIPLFLISEHAKDYWNNLYKKFIFLDMLLILLIILLTERKSNSPLLAGALLIPAALIVSLLKKVGAGITKIFLNPISSSVTGDNTNEIISQIVGIFFAESTKVFLWMFIIGIILIGIGLFFKLTALGIKIKNKIQEKVLKQKVEELEQKNEKLEKQINNKNIPKQNLNVNVKKK